MNIIHREFPYYYNENIIIGHYGQIHIDIYEGNWLQVIIYGFLDNIGSITITMSYPKSQENNLYNITLNILNKISDELYYKYFGIVIGRIDGRKKRIRGIKSEETKRIQSDPIDMILYYKTGIPPPEENWNPPNEESSLYWKPFTAENMKFLDINPRDDTFDENPDLKIPIDENGDFDCAEFSQHLWDNYVNVDSYGDDGDDCEYGEDNI
jgi:hypothetical protein